MSQSTGLYSGWRRERFGPFAGLSGRQAGAIALSWFPALAAVGRSHWGSALQLGVVSVVPAALVALPAWWERKDAGLFKESQAQALRVSGRTP